MKKRKKLWIILLSVALGFFVILGGTYFATQLSTVSVEFRTRLAQGETRLAEGVLDNVKDSAEFNYKDSVLFMDTQKHIDKIEKSNPYVKVQQVIRKFPNKVCVYISERIPKYRIADAEDSSSWFILDEEFKVLQKVNELGDFEEKTIEVKYFTATTSVGDFLNKTSEQLQLNTLLSGVYGRTKDYFAVRSIDYLSSENTFCLTMRTSVKTDDGTINYAGGCVIQIENSGNLKYKALNATCVYVGDGDKMEGRDLSQKQIIVADENDCVIKNQG